jgi:hypothetical protein
VGGEATTSTLRDPRNNSRVLLINRFLVAQASDAAAIATLVIAAIAGVGVGGIIVALINTRQERERQLRESMLTAADEFLDAAASALSHLRTLHPSARRINLGLIGFLAHGRMNIDSPANQREDSPELQAAELQKTDALLEVAKDRLARVRLLFSPDSLAANDGQAFLKASEIVSVQLKTYYALGQPELVHKIQQRRESVRKLGEIADQAGDVPIPIPLGAVALPIPIGTITSIVQGAFSTLSDVEGARNNAQQLAQQSLVEADAAIASFTRHAWEALRKPSWKAQRPRRGPWLRGPSRPVSDVASNTEAIHTSSVKAPAADAHPGTDA